MAPSALTCLVWTLPGRGSVRSPVLSWLFISPECQRLLTSSPCPVISLQVCPEPHHFLPSSLLPGELSGAHSPEQPVICQSSPEAGVFQVDTQALWAVGDAYAFLPHGCSFWARRACVSPQEGKHSPLPQVI